MGIKFTKMHGCGNDYIYINCFDCEVLSLDNPTNKGGAERSFRRVPTDKPPLGCENSADWPERLAAELSDRHFGIGGDGLVLILRSSVADARMRMFNADGSEGRMCGNAIRCVGKYLYDNGLVTSRNVTIETLSGIKELALTVENNRVIAARVNMGRPEFAPDKIPVALPGEKIINHMVSLGNPGRDYYITCVSMGNPHAVVFCPDPAGLDLPALGPVFENAGIFPHKVNTEFVKVINENLLEMRVWERGSGETLACGTGACAAAVSAVENGFCGKDRDITVKLRGGELVINYGDEAVFMTGNCVKVFDGEI
ncbi:MAG: diaminopimelate epimerase [Clostridiales bacterium]|jgi:carbamoyl-phosphate synthase large subunit|nr:diaminopimelate epimerase [Clostridiales bacterium]